MAPSREESRPTICLLVLSAPADDPRVRRQGEAFHRAGWNVVAVGMPGARSPAPEWRIVTRDDLPPPQPEPAAVALAAAVAVPQVDAAVVAAVAVTEAEPVAFAVASATVTPQELDAAVARTGLRSLLRRWASRLPAATQVALRRRIGRTHFVLRRMVGLPGLAVRRTVGLTHTAVRRMFGLTYKVRWLTLKPVNRFRYPLRLLAVRIRPQLAH